MIGGTPMCYGCKHFNKATQDRFCCTAFPEAIPLIIILSSLDHHFPALGDHGVRFESSGGKQYGLATRPRLHPLP